MKRSFVLLITALMIGHFTVSNASAQSGKKNVPEKSVKSSKKKKSGIKGNEPSLWGVYENLSRKKFVDLTHAFSPGIPRWKGYPDEKRKTLYNYKRDGFWAERYTLVGQWGTHVDPPAHFHEGLKTVDEIPVKQMIAPLVVIDVSEASQDDPDLLLSVDHILAWEKKHGKIPKDAFVAMRTDWSERWPDLILMQNVDEQGGMHYPGWSVEAIRFLVEDRKIVAIGHETTDTDGGHNVSVDRYPAQAYIHGEDHFQIELLANLKQVPEFGAIAIISFPKPENGSGFPARVFAILP